MFFPVKFWTKQRSRVAKIKMLKPKKINKGSKTRQVILFFFFWFTFDYRFFKEEVLT